jgi:hypothetical protein
MECVITVRYSVCFNNVHLDSFVPTRGLHQGDLLSPYLFLFVANGLSKLMQKEIQSGNLHELHICRRAPGISHLLFADDTLMFLETNAGQAEIIKNIIQRYEEGTCQLINPSKSSMLFGAHYSSAQQEEVMNILAVTTSKVEEKYLGLPTPAGRMGKGKFKSTKEWLVKHFSTCAERQMSNGAKEVLIKLVAQAIPTYVMGVFKLLAKMCEEMTHLIRHFWWAEDGDKRKVHWSAWDKLTMTKGYGGMGFQNLKLFNQALLARQAWRLIQFSESLCARLLKARYYPNGDIIDTIFPSEGSPTWKTVEYGLDLVKKALCGGSARV